MINMVFKEPVGLQQEADRDITVEHPAEYKFAKNIMAVPIAWGEIGEAAKDYPLFFGQGANGTFVPLAIMGVKEGQNLFVNRLGKWEKQRYVPTLFRMYPFVGNQTGKEVNIAYDKSYPGINSGNGERFFEKSGEPTEYGKRIMQLVAQYYGELEYATQQLSKLAEAGILEKRNIDLQVEGEVYRLTDVWQVNPSKLKALSDSQLLTFAKEGLYYLIQSHLNSLTNILKLTGMAAGK